MDERTVRRERKKKWCWKSTYGSFDRRRAELPDAVARATGMLYKIKDEEGAGHEEGRKKWKLQSSKGSGRGECLCNVRWELQPFYFLNCGMLLLRDAAGAAEGDRCLEVNNMLSDRMQWGCGLHSLRARLG